jgi:type IX secretion system substrate protein
MNKLLLFASLFFLTLEFNLFSQCPVAYDATIVNVENSGSDRTFDIELNYSVEQVDANNSSLKFTISICGGADLLTTNCMGPLRKEESPYITTIDDPALVAPSDALICVSYSSWTNSTCGGNNCTVNEDIPVLGSLPIDLVSFVGYEDKFGRVKLEWVTASEEQNDYFTIERSADGKIFQEIGIVEGNGNSSTEKYYSFTDERSLRGENYYRLKQTDLDNAYEYSKVILVENKIDKLTALTLVPSVVRNEVTLIFNQLPKANKFIGVFNQNGVNIFNVILAEGEYTINLDVSTYAPGMYFIRVPIGKEFVVKKFIKVVD